MRKNLFAATCGACVLIASAPSAAWCVVWDVSSLAGLDNAMASLQNNDTVIIEPGTYHLNHGYFVTQSNVTIRGATGNRNDVILDGGGMNNASDYSRYEGIGIAAADVTVRDLTVEEFYHHAVHFQPGADRAQVLNVRTRNIGEQHMKGAATSTGGVIANCLLEQTYTRTNDGVARPDNYVGGIDLIGMNHWTVRDNVVTNIRGISGGGAGILFWVDTTNETVERNTVLGCSAGIHMGNTGVANGVRDSIVRNNFIAATRNDNDALLSLAFNQNVKVYNNTLYGGVPNGTYWFTMMQVYDDGVVQTQNLDVRNNLIRGQVWDRAAGDWSSAAVAAMGNLVDTTGSTILPSWFVDPLNGNLRLTADATGAIGAGVVLADAQYDIDSQFRGLPGQPTDLGASLRVVEFTWTGNGGPGNARWDVAGNWATNSAPAANSSDVTFGTSFANGNAIDLGGNRFVQVMTFTNTDSNDLTFANGTLSLAGIRKQVGNGSVTFDSTVAASVIGGAVIENNGTGGQIAFNGIVNVLGAGVTFTGAEPIVVNGMLNDNGFGIINNGTLVTSGTTLAAGISGSGNNTLQAGARLTAGYVRQGQLAIGDGALAAIRPAATANASTSTSRVGSLSIDGGPVPSGKLDLNNNSLIIDYSGAVGTILSNVTAQIASGRNGKDANDQANWNGKGIITSTGRAANVAAKVDFFNLGAINNADLDLLGIGSSLSTFGGQAVAPNTVLVKYTYSGDADLSGTVDGDDYTYWLNGFLGLTDPSVQGWLRGDFDYNGVVDGDDYTQWLNAFLLNGPPLASANGPAAVPEPATAVLLGLGAFLLAACARGRQSSRSFRSRRRPSGTQ